MTYNQALNFLKVKQREATAEKGKHNETAIAINEKAIEAIEKQIPKKPLIDPDGACGPNYICPACGESIMSDCGDVYCDYPLNFCDHCGQRIDLEDENGED